jgi:hypothetical protein
MDTIFDNARNLAIDPTAVDGVQAGAGGDALIPFWMWILAIFVGVVFAYGYTKVKKEKDDGEENKNK